MYFGIIDGMLFTCANRVPLKTNPTVSHHSLSLMSHVLLDVHISNGLGTALYETSIPFSLTLHIMTEQTNIG